MIRSSPISVTCSFITLFLSSIHTASKVQKQHFSKNIAAMSSTNATTFAPASEAPSIDESSATITNDPSRLSISDTALSFSPSDLKFGDLLFYLESYQLLVVTRIDSSGVYLGWPEFSINHKPGTWTLSGGSVTYTPVSPNIFWDPLIEWEFLSTGEPIILNPTGLQVREHQFKGMCPWWKCDIQFICTCLGAGGFEELDATCEECDGFLLACPVCHGREFAYEDMLCLRRLAEECDQVEKDRIWKERCGRINTKRKELGLWDIAWGMPFEVEEEDGDFEDGGNDEGSTVGLGYVETADECLAMEAVEN
jgi:hypothetical protein